MKVFKKLVNNLGDDKFQAILRFVKLNYLLIFFYPSFIFLHLYYLNLYKSNNLLDLFIIIGLLNQFDIGLLKNTFFHQKKYKLLIVVTIITGCLVLLSFLSMGILLLFELNFQFKYIFIALIGLFANEFKSYFDSKSNYSKGFIIKNLLNLSVVYIFLNMTTSSVMTELILISSIAFICFLFLYVKLNLEVKNSIHSSEFKFFFLNIFAFISGNIDRFLVIPFIGLRLRNTYLYFTETNMKLYGSFGFLNNMFLYKQLKLSLKLILAIGLLLVIAVFSIYVIFDIEYNYLLFSVSLIISIFAQYYISSKIGDLEGLSVSFFPAIGMSIYLVLFYFLNKYLILNLLILTFILVVKSLSELAFIYLVISIKRNHSN